MACRNGFVNNAVAADGFFHSSFERLSATAPCVALPPASMQSRTNGKIINLTALGLLPVPSHFEENYDVNSNTNPKNNPYPPHVVNGGSHIIQCMCVLAA
jgi:hypothetical protein